MIGEADFRRAFRKLALGKDTPVIVHASLSAFGDVEGGAQAVVSALLAEFHVVLAPVFTYRTMIAPEAGPPDNAMVYGRHSAGNRLAIPFGADMPADRLMGVIPEKLRLHPLAQRSGHPILSFTGVHAAQILQAQTLDEPLGPVQALAGAGGWTLLLGVDHTVNTSIHYGEQLAGRKGFIRWAVSGDRVVECPSFPGCSDGFDVLAPRLEAFTRRVDLGKGRIQAVHLQQVFAAVAAALAEDNLALLCSRSYCERCNAQRARWGEQIRND